MSDGDTEGVSIRHELPARVDGSDQAVVWPQAPDSGACGLTYLTLIIPAPTPHTPISIHGNHMAGTHC